MSTICDTKESVMIMGEALIFSVEEFSAFDGPGIRTTVFLKGCPLRCGWCHNPEGQSYGRQIMKAQSGCTGCGRCVAAGGGVLNEKSIAACPNRLLRCSGTRYTPEGLTQTLEGNFDILKMSGGGVTFSGGEPLSHPDFLLECLALLKGQIHTAVQTSGYCHGDVFQKVLEKTDCFLFDIKLIDTSAHRRHTGVGNEKIIRNFQTLRKSGKPFTVRTPLIPGVTDTPENLSGIAELLNSQDVKYIELLPYNKAAGGKYAALGRTYTPGFDERVPADPHLEIFERRGIQAAVL